MQLWDDLITSKERVMVIAATNRPEDIDPAVRRRFERSFLIALPDAAARSEIFKKVLDSTQTDGGIDYAYCAENSDGFCSSDIVAVCKAAMAIPVHERRAALKKALLAGTTNSTASGNQLAFRPLTMEDIKATMTGFQPTSRLPPKTSSSSSKGFGTPGKSNSDVLPPSEPKAGGGFGMTNRPFPGSNQFDDAYGSESDETFDDEDDEDEL